MIYCNVDILIKVDYPALKDRSDCKKAQILVGVLKSATSMFGALCVVIFIGDLQMPKLHADSWDFHLLALLLFLYRLFLMALDGVG